MAEISILNEMKTTAAGAIYLEDLYLLNAAAGGSMAKYSGPVLSANNLSLISTGSGSLTSGTYYYTLTYSIANGADGTTGVFAETTTATTASITISAGQAPANVQIDLTNTVPDLLKAADAICISRTIYRKKDAGSWARVVTLRNSKTTGYTDNVSSPTTQSPPTGSNLSVPFIGQGRNLETPIGFLNPVSFTTANLVSSSKTVSNGELWQISSVYSSTGTARSMSINGFEIYSTKSDVAVRQRSPFLAGAGDTISTNQASGNFNIAYRVYYLNNISVVTTQISTGAYYNVPSGYAFVLLHFYHSSGANILVSRGGTQYAITRNTTWSAGSNNPLSFPLVFHGGEYLTTNSGTLGTINGYLVLEPIF